MKKISIFSTLGILLVLASCGVESNTSTTTSNVSQTTSETTSTSTTTTTEKKTTTATTTAKETTTTTTTTKETTTTTTVTPTTTTSDSYYSSVNMTSSDTLKSSLNAIINKGFVSQSYSEDSTHLQSIDSYDGNYVECLYTGLRLDKDAIGNQWNKEHIWAKSLGFGSTEYNAYSDLHHLRVTQMAANSNRANKYFAEGGTSTVYGYSYTSDTFEPRDEVKGDVARMILYMTVMYDSSTLDLELTNDTSKIQVVTGGEAYIGLLDTILKWNMEDPVDSREMARNDAIYGIQKNRNPFIDHPSYAYYLYTSDYNRLGYSESDATALESNRTLKDDSAIVNVNSLIKAIPQSISSSNAVEFEDALETANAAYSNLTSESKSFVSGYKDLTEAETKLEAYQSALSQDKTISTTFDFTTQTANSGTIVENGISLAYTSSVQANSKGIYVQKSKPLTCTVSNVYSTIKSVVVSYTSNTTTTSCITITDGTNKVTKTVNATSSKSSETFDVTGLDLTKTLTITVTNEGSKSVMVSAIKFSI